MSPTPGFFRRIRRRNRHRAIRLMEVEPLEGRCLLTAVTEYPLPPGATNPQAIVAGPDGALWFTEAGSSMIGRVTLSGSISQYAIPTAGSQPEGIASGPDGALWFAESGANKIGRVTTTGNFQEFTVPTNSSDPQAITSGPDGALWFTESNTGKIGRVTTTGQITEYTLPAGSSPWGITAGPDGALWFTDTGSNAIGRITTSGAVTEYAVPTSNAGLKAIAAGPDGAVWFAENKTNAIGRITTSGALSAFPITPADTQPVGMVSGPDGNLWFTEAAGGVNSVGTMTPTGSIVQTKIPSGGAKAAGIAVGPDGALWFAESGSNRIGRIAALSDLPLSATGTTLSATEGASASGVVATFTDADVNAMASEYTATVDWGDGTTSSGSVASSGQGGFTVNSSKTYARAGQYTVTTTIHDVGGAVATASGTVQVAPATLTIQAPTISTTEGSAFSGVLAQFTDSNPAAVAGDFTVTIDWGDGTTDAGQVVAGGSGFSVQGQHTYKRAGSDGIRLSIAELEGAQGTATSTATVADAPLSASLSNLSFLSGSAFTGVIATFADANPYGSAADFTATIDWGDGTTTAGAVAFDASSGRFTVTGSHTYGPLSIPTIRVSILDTGGASTSASGTAFVTPFVLDPALTADGVTLAPTEGAPFSGVVARFTDADPSGSLGQYSATIDWGDGQTSSGTIGYDAAQGVFTVSGTTTYTEEGRDAVTVAIRDVAGASATAGGSATVADAALTASGATLNATEGAAFSGLVGSFTDADPARVASDFTATIDWGDGSVTQGQVVASGGGFAVVGSHTFAEDGTVAVTVTVRDAGGTVTSAGSTVQVADAPLSASPLTVGATEGTSFSAAVATFMDANPNAAPGDFTTTIDWGDGTTSAGQVEAQGAAFAVVGTHMFAEGGTTGFSVTILDAGGATASAGSTAVVADLPLSGSAATIAATQGAPFSGAVATFTDADPSAVAGDFSATIDWGDGQTSSGTVASNGQGGFSVSGTNSYTGSGLFTVVVAVHDNGGAAAAIDSTAQVSSPALTVQFMPVSATEGTALGGLIAKFWDSPPSATVSNFTAKLDWGDGSTSLGTIQGPASGQFHLFGPHVYAEAGSYTVTLELDDSDGTTAFATTTVVVADAPMTEAPGTISATEGGSFSGAVATFTDANPLAVISDYSATIDWGDGTTDAGQVVAISGGFAVNGSHAYADEGSKPVVVTILDRNGASTSVSITATVGDAALSATSGSVAATSGMAFQGTVANFTDANPNATVGDFTATIDWGDGQTSSGTIGAGGSGGFAVGGSHTYARPASHALSVTIHDVGGSSASTGTTAQVAAPTVTVQPASIQTTEGVTFRGALATFTDSNPSATTFAVTIDWGDGTTQSGTVNRSGGGGNAFAHAYAEAGSYPVVIQVSDSYGGSGTGRTTAAVADAGLTAQAVPVQTGEGAAFTGTVATFTDANPLALAGDFTATIDWGDGTTTSGTVTASASGFVVSGGHAYQDEGSPVVTVTVNDREGALATVVATAAVSDAALSATSATITAVEGEAFSGAVASFTDANPLASAADFTATIDWGDGTTSTGTVAVAGSGFAVSGGHTYLEEGAPVVAVKVRDSGGALLTTAATAVVSDAALSATSATISAVEGAAFSGLVATFADADPNGVPSDFTATIDWGDGTTSGGTVTATPSGLAASGGHTFADTSVTSIKVAIRDNGGAAATAASPTAVADAPLAAAPPSIAGSAGIAFRGPVATFTDANPNATVGDFTATIDWGDGQTSSGTIGAGGPGGFAVNGTHTYAQPGPYAVRVSIRDVDGSSATTGTTAQVAAPTVTVQPAPIRTTEGVSLRGTPATFTDSDPQATTFTMTVDWGDGTTQSGTVDRSGGGGNAFAHAYAEAGSYPVLIQVGDSYGGRGIGRTTAVVADARLTARAVPVQASEGAAFSGAVATFTDANPLGSAADFTATIDWGDGTTTSGTVTASASGFVISGGHTYQEEGSPVVTVTANDREGAFVMTVATAAVSDAPVSATPATISAVEGEAFSGLVAKFADADPNGLVGDFTATIDWGDGTTSGGTVTATPSGFAVSGGHTFANTSVTSVRVTIHDNGGATATAASPTAVADAPLAAAPVNVAASAGIAFQGQVAKFTDANPLAVPGDFTATIDWGDGQSSSGTVGAGSTGGFAVSGSHTYAQPGPYAVRVSIRDVDGSSATTGTTAQVASPTVTVQPASIQTTEGVSLRGTPATFTDSDPQATTFAVTIDWGDGTTGSGTVNGSSGGVTLAHAYAEAGSYPVVIQVSDGYGGRGTGWTTAVVADAALSARPVAVATSEGAAFGGTLATFTDANPLALAGDFTATIDWGDGTTSAGTVTASAGGFAVSGGHTYQEEGSPVVTVTVNDHEGALVTVVATAAISDAALSATPATMSALAGVKFSGAVATFADADPSAAVGDYTATIDWGDGTTSAGTIGAAPSGQGFVVLGSQTYSRVGSFAVLVTIKDTGGASALGRSSIAVGGGTLAANALTVNATEGAPYRGAVATFADSDNGLWGGDFTATIDWGDGTTTSGQVVSAAGAYAVVGRHTFAEEGTRVVGVTITGPGGSGAGVASTAVVADAPLHAQPVTITATEGESYQGVVATFTDDNPAATVADYTAVIDWGDGSQTAGVVRFDTTQGVWDVVGFHTFAEEGNAPVRVTINDVGGTSAVTTGAATVADAPLAAAGSAFGAVAGQPYSGVVAMFTDADPAGTPNDFTAVINWGDGVTTPGSIGYDAVDGTFTVSGAHTYTGVGQYPVGVSIADGGGASALVSSSASVTTATVSANGRNIAATEGQWFAGVVAGFAGAGAAAQYAATITWGDGQSSPGTIGIDPATGWFTVKGSNRYAEEGLYGIRVVIRNAQGVLATVGGVANVGDASLSATGLTLTATEGVRASDVVATFTDGNPKGSIGEFTATIDWGDGRTSVGTIGVDAMSHTFTVSGFHQYAEEGSYTLQVLVADAGSATATATSLVAVAEAPVVATGELTVQATEGNSSGAVALATFRDPAGAGSLSDYVATINWGDGETTAGAITLESSTGLFTVWGAKRYAEEGAYSIVVSVVHDGLPAVSVSDQAVVTDAPLAAQGASLAGDTGQPVSAVVATFTDGDPGATVGSFTATIDWGDGQTAAGTVGRDPSRGVLTVAGSHVYDGPGRFPIRVQIADDGGAQATAAGEATVAAATLSAAGRTVVATEGQPFSGVVATFTSSDPGASAGEFSATITWGDGQSSAGVVVVNQATGGFTVSGMNTYAEEGLYAIRVAIRGPGGTSVSAGGVGRVADAPLLASAETVSATTGVPFSGSLAAFRDGNPNSTAGDFSVTIDWGDGEVTGGVVTYDASAKMFVVEGTHTYRTAGDDAVRIVVTDAGGQTATVQASVLVEPAPGGLGNINLPPVIPMPGTGPTVVSTSNAGVPASPPPVTPPRVPIGDGETFQVATTPTLPKGTSSGSGLAAPHGGASPAAPAGSNSQNPETQTTVQTSAAFASQMIANELAMSHGPSLAMAGSGGDGLPVRFLGALGSVAPIGPGDVVRAEGELFQELDRLEKQVDESQPLHDVQSAVEAGVVVSVGYILLQSRGLYWLLSALAAGPAWSPFDPLKILTDWEEEQKRNPRPGPEREEDGDGEDESLQSILERGRDGRRVNESAAHDATQPGARKPHRKPPVRRAGARIAARSRGRRPQGAEGPL